MNDGDGFQVLSHARGQPTTVATPFLLMTGRFEPGIMRRGMAMGADDFILKPFSPKQLIASVNARLNRTETPHNQGKATEQRLAEVVNSLPLLVGMCDPNEAMMTFLNQPGYSMLNVDSTIPAQALNLRDILCGPGTEIDLPSLLEQLRQGTPWKGEHSLGAGQGARPLAMLQITPHLDSTGRVEYISIIGQPLAKPTNENPVD
jgi:CheY-like chemotaxis protein